MTQGQSAYTKFKTERFSPVLAQSLRISKAPTVAHYPYFHIDLNAGGGYNHHVGVPGSPLNFLSAKDRNQRHNFYAMFCDNDAQAIEELITQPAILAQPRERIHIFPYDNSEVLPSVAQFIVQKERRPQFAMGSIIIDPNGYHNGVPWEALRTFCAAYRRLDLFVNLNVRSFRLEAPHIRRGVGEWAQYRLQPISEFADWFSRPHWMITPVVQIQGCSWVQLVGRTMQTQTADYLSLGFYDIYSAVGCDIVASIETSRKMAEQPVLPELLGVSAAPDVSGDEDGGDDED